MKAKICFIRSNSIRPDSRVEKETKALCRAGYSVHIVAWDRDSDHKQETGKLIDEFEVTITRIGCKASFGEGFKNIFPYIRFQVRMMIYLFQHRKEIDIIHACDFDTAFFSSIIAKITKTKFVFDIFDFLYGEPQNLLQKIVKRAQIRLINNADATIICTEDRKKQIIDSRPRKLAVIHNSPPTVARTDVGSVSTGNKLSVVYVGILQDYRLILEEIEYFKEHPEYTFNIGGFGKYEAVIREASAVYENIKFFGRIKYNDTLKLEQQSNIMLAIYDPTIENHRYAAPNKFYEALMLGKPVIMVKGTGMSNEVEENDIGVLIDYSLDGFDKGIKELSDRRNEWPMMSQRMKELYKKKYSWEEMEHRLIQLYSEITK